MLLSMTGFGTGRAEANGIVATVEARSVNNRHLKVTVRGSDPYPHLDSEFEKRIRKSIRRGTVNLLVNVRRPLQTGTLTLNTDVVAAYLAQLSPLIKDLSAAQSAALLSGVLALPGVAADSFASNRPPRKNGLSSNGQLNPPWPNSQKCVWQKAARWPTNYNC